MEPVFFLCSGVRKIAYVALELDKVHQTARNKQTLKFIAHRRFDEQDGIASNLSFAERTEV